MRGGLFVVEARVLPKGGSALGFGVRPLAHRDTGGTLVERGEDIGSACRGASATPGEERFNGNVLAAVGAAPLGRGRDRLIAALANTPIEDDGKVRVTGPIRAEHVIEPEIITAHDDELASHLFGRPFPRTAGRRARLHAGAFLMLTERAGRFQESGRSRRGAGRGSMAPRGGERRCASSVHGAKRRAAHGSSALASRSKTPARPMASAIGISKGSSRCSPRDPFLRPDGYSSCHRTTREPTVTSWR